MDKIYKEPDFSIITITFNNDNLVKTVRSILELKQRSLMNIEHVLINGGSHTEVSKLHSFKIANTNIANLEIELENQPTSTISNTWSSRRNKRRQQDDTRAFANLEKMINMKIMRRKLIKPLACF